MSDGWGSYFLSGWINLNHGLTLSGTGSVNLGTGILTVNDATSQMSGGSLSGNVYIGNSGTGTFTQTGGTNAGYVDLGCNSGDHGTYNLSGSGLLTAQE